MIRTAGSSRPHRFTRDLTNFDKVGHGDVTPGDACDVTGRDVTWLAQNGLVLVHKSGTDGGVLWLQLLTGVEWGGDGRRALSRFPEDFHRVMHHTGRCSCFDVTHAPLFLKVGAWTL